MAKFIPGYANPVLFQLFINGSAGTTVTLKITGWNATDEVQRLITTYAGGQATQGQQSAVAGIRDWTANVTANVASDAMPWNLASPIIPGYEGLMGFYVHPASRFFTVGVMILKTNPASAVAGLVTYNFDVGMQSEFVGYQFTAPANTA